MVFQLRKFRKLENKDLGIEEDLNDIYVFKNNSQFIGVKFRNIQQKKYGFKIRSVQIKLCSLNHFTQKTDQHQQFFQQWIKFRVDFKYKLYSQFFFNNKEVFADNIKQHSKKQNYQAFKLNNFQEQLKNLNQQLVKTIKNDLKYDKFTLNMYPHFQKWLNAQYPISQLYYVKKDKKKTSLIQIGLIKVTPMYMPLKDELIFQTVSIQSQNKDKIAKFVKKEERQWNFTLYSEEVIQKQIKQLKFQFNISYPQLLQDIFMEYKST